ncbi:MAG: NAD(P)-dependent oxidoreductase [Pirellulaceae bacterium]|nr:NAD(P)-dependent oxidoreductase [Pirellulaceae bacterium]
MNPPVGIIGVGLLGTALAERMLAGGYAVLGYDANPARLDHLRALRGAGAVSPTAIAERCDTIVLCLPDSRTVGEVVCALGDALRPGMLLVDATTGDPEDTVALAAALRGRGIGYFDATLVGSSEQVRRGQGVVLLGGDPADASRAEPVLRTWSERRFHVGPAGSGARMKLVVNLVLGLNRAVLAEGLSLARAVGIDPQAALEVLRATPARSAVMETKGPKMVAGDFTPQARLAQHRKDVGLIRQLARRAGALVPLSDVHEELLRRAVELGLGEADNSAILRAFEPPLPAADD